MSIAKILGMSVWIGILTAPLAGLESALRVCIAIFLGGLIWRGLIQSRIKIAVWDGAGFFEIFRRPLLAFGEFSKSAMRPGLYSTAALLLVPLFLNDYYVDVLTTVGLYIVLALGLNVVLGMAGLLDLGYVSFYAIGAYFYGLSSTHLGLSFWWALPMGGLVTFGVGFLFGLITLRLRGDYLAIVTLGLIHIVHLILNNWDRLTQGPNGILGIERPSIGGFVFDRPIHFYYLIVFIGMIAVLTVNRLHHSPVGRAWRAIRQDELAASAMGIDTTRMKILAFSIGALWAGVAGVFFAGKFGFISPESFTFFESIMILSMVVLGGMGSIPGVMLGAVIFVALPELLRDFSSYRMLIFGAVLVAVMVYRPRGLLGGVRRRLSNIHPEESG